MLSVWFAIVVIVFKVNYLNDTAKVHCAVPGEQTFLRFRYEIGGFRYEMLALKVFCSKFGNKCYVINFALQLPHT